jgi:GT2 family glycosyltransferase
MPPESASAPVISVIVPVHNAADVLDNCLTALFSSTYTAFECIVVDDGAIDESLSIARRYPTRILTVPGGPLGPAHARNVGAASARGTILLFVDADVAVHRATLATAADIFEGNPSLAAVFGSYDDRPESPDLVSQYRNLFHHFVHQHASEEGGTFWSGCGSVRREVFRRLGGFDEKRYGRPSIEDIDFGYRLHAAGYRIRLNKNMQATHLKRWTLRRMVQTDLLDRAIPWTLLGLRLHNLPNDLNLRYTQRLSAALVCVALGAVGVGAVFSPLDTVLLLLLAVLALLVIGYWPWSDPRRRVASFSGTCATLGLSGAIAGATAFNDNWTVTALVGPVIVGILAKYPALHLKPFLGWTWFSVALGSLTAAGVLVLLDLPLLLAGTVVSCIGLVLALNWRLYAFLARQRGVLFAFSVVPLHLFYFLYSVVAFVVGAAIHVWTNRAEAVAGKTSSAHG